MIRFVILVLMAFAFMSCSHNSSITDSNGKVFVILGSSSAFGVGASVVDSSWAGMLKKQIAGVNSEWKFMNLSVSGFTTYHVMPTVSTPPPNRPLPVLTNNIDFALKYGADIILVSLPSNDIANGFTNEEFLQNLKTLDSYAKSKGADMWFTTTQPRNMDSLRRDNLIKMKADIESTFGVKSIDFFTPLHGGIGSIYYKLSADGIHPNNAGHKKLFDVISTSKLIDSFKP